MISLRFLAIGFLSISLVLQESCTVAFHSNNQHSNHGFVSSRRQSNSNGILNKGFPPETIVPRTNGVNLKALPVGDAASMEAIFKSSDTLVFLLGVFPFAWATVEFWRRIMFGEAFGTGSDQIIIGMDDSPEDSRGRRVLGRGALGTAYFLFAASFATLAVVIYSVVSSAPPPDVLPLPAAGDVIEVVAGNL